MRGIIILRAILAVAVVVLPLAHFLLCLLLYAAVLVFLVVHLAGGGRRYPGIY